MKKLSLCSLLAFAALALAAPAINAADGDDAPPPARRARGNPEAGNRHAAPRLNGPKLSPEERKKIHAAILKANDDAEVKKAQEKQKKLHAALLAAQKEYQAALKAAVVKEDPSLKETVEKFKDAPLPGSRGAFGANRGAPNGERPAGQPPRRGAKGPKKAPSADNI